MGYKLGAKRLMVIVDPQCHYHVRIGIFLPQNCFISFKMHISINNN